MLDVDEWIEDLGAPPKGRAVSTLRSYPGAVRGFMEYLTDERYPWVAICEREFGTRPVQILFEENSIGHLSEFEGEPTVRPSRPLTREELVIFFDYCDERGTYCAGTAQGLAGGVAWSGAVQDGLRVGATPR